MNREEILFALRAAITSRDSGTFLAIVKHNHPADVVSLLEEVYPDHVVVRISRWWWRFPWSCRPCGKRHRHVATISAVPLWARPGYRQRTPHYVYCRCHRCRYLPIYGTRDSRHATDQSLTSWQACGKSKTQPF